MTDWVKTPITLSNFYGCEKIYCISSPELEPRYYLEFRSGVPQQRYKKR